jgi:hypothetical protein
MGRNELKPTPQESPIFLKESKLRPEFPTRRLCNVWWIALLSSQPPLVLRGA